MERFTISVTIVLLWYSTKDLKSWYGQTTLGLPQLGERAQLVVSINLQPVHKTHDKINNHNKRNDSSRPSRLALPCEFTNFFSSTNFGLGTRSFFGAGSFWSFTWTMCPNNKLLIWPLQTYFRTSNSNGLILESRTFSHPMGFSRTFLDYIPLNYRHCAGKRLIVLFFQNARISGVIILHNWAQIGFHWTSLKVSHMSFRRWNN